MIVIEILEADEPGYILARRLDGERLTSREWEEIERALLETREQEALQ